MIGSKTFSKTKKFLKNWRKQATYHINMHKQVIADLQVLGQTCDKYFDELDDILRAHGDLEEKIASAELSYYRNTDLKWSAIGIYLN